MTINYQTQRVTVPTVFVTKGRQRVKQYNQNVYLKNGDEFELELFNPTTNKVLAKISLNGKPLGSGIVLRPGERVFLERYLDEAKKFRFETYEVNVADPNVREAIRNNGEVQVEFYDEYRCPSYSNSITYTYKPCWTPDPFWTTGPYWGTSGLYYSQSMGVTGTQGPSGVASTPTASYSCTTSGSTKTRIDGNQLQFSDNFAPVEPIETGRVEKGGYSDQSLMCDTTSFNSYYSWKTTWKILPDSQKVFAKEDLKVFCTKCGAKRKKSSHRFCPNCGIQF